MRNMITVFALLVSVTGIFVSLAREELRCKLGLHSEECLRALQKNEPIRERIAPNSEMTDTSGQQSPVSTPEENPGDKAVQSKENTTSTELSTTDKTVTNEEKRADTTGQKILKPTEEKPAQNLPSNDQATSIAPEVPTHESSQMDTTGDGGNSQTQGNPAPDSQPIPVIAPPLDTPKSE